MPLQPCHSTPPAPWENNHSVAAFATSYTLLERRETLHWYIYKKKKVLDRQKKKKVLTQHTLTPPTPQIKYKHSFRHISLGSHMRWSGMVFTKPKVSKTDISSVAAMVATQRSMRLWTAWPGFEEYWCYNPQTYSPSCDLECFCCRFKSLKRLCRDESTI